MERKAAGRIGTVRFVAWLVDPSMALSEADFDKKREELGASLRIFGLKTAWKVGLGPTVEIGLSGTLPSVRGGFWPSPNLPKQ